MRPVWLGLILVACDPTISPGPGPDLPPAFEPDPLCEYVDYDTFYVTCPGEADPRSFTHFFPTGGLSAECPDHYGAEEGTWLDAADVIAAMGCDASCVYAHDQAVMLLYCGTRGEYVTFDPRGPGQDGDGATCPDLMRVSTVAGGAWVSNFEEYEATHTCP